MNFYNVATTYSHIKGMHLTKLDELAWYEKIVENPKGLDGNALVALSTEYQWLKHGKPYYKVYTDMADMIAATSVDIPVTEVRVPYTSFAVLLGEDNNYRDDDIQCKWILIHEIHVEAETKTRFRATLSGAGRHRALAISYGFSGEDRHGQPRQYTYTLPLFGKQTVEEFFNDTWAESSEALADGDDWVPPEDLVRSILKLAVATCFFGVDRHEVVLPDLTRRQIERAARKAPAAGEISTLKAAKDEGVKEGKWTIGRELSLPRPLITTVAGTGDGGRREVSHAFMRRGFMRYQACGKGWQEHKLIFVPPTVCRSDLGLPKGQKGYRIEGEQREAKRK